MGSPGRSVLEGALGAWISYTALCVSFGSVSGLPNKGPDMCTCKKHAVVPPHNTVVSCCPPLPTRPIKDFEFEDQTLPMRVRRPAHKADAAYIEKYNRAYELMRALPQDDPRSFHQQSNIHCAYCGFGFKQLGINVTLEMHGTWLTFPFHRWYIYFHERILASLLNDNSFALPFWNWDSMVEPERPSQIPEYFYTMPALVDPLRNPRHRTPAVPDLSTDLTGRSPMDSKNATLEEVIESNNNLLYQTVVSGATLPPLFLGKPLRGGVEKTSLGASAFEVGPHGAIHGWVGDPAQPNGEDMVHLYSAARDPIFYAHHANCDRMWNDWKNLPGGKRTGFEDDPDWMESQLLFYDENADLIRVKVKDSLDNVKLRYTYEEVDNPWAHHESLKVKKQGKSLSSSVAATGLSSTILKQNFDIAVTKCGEGTRGISFSNNAYHVYIPLGSVNVATKRRGLLDLLQLSLVVAEEVLILENIQSPTGKKISFKIFMDIDADDTISTADVSFVATYNNLPLRSVVEEQKQAKVTFSVAIGMKLRSLGLHKHICIPISLVPNPGTDGDGHKISVGNIYIKSVVA